MKNTVGVRPTKEQKRQEFDAKQDGKLMPSNNIALREAGKKLQKLKPNESISNTNAYNVLLKKLRAGELSAGFYVTSNPDSWIEIPNDYWLHVAANRFRDILINDNDARGFKIRPREFAGQIAAIFVKRADADPAATTQALTSFMTAAASGYERKSLSRFGKSFWKKAVLLIRQRKRRNVAAGIRKIRNGSDLLHTYWAIVSLKKPARAPKGPTSTREFLS
jgi:hypothetical protein